MQSINRYAWSFVDANDLPSFSRFFRRFSVIKTCLLMNIISAAGKLALTKDPQPDYVIARKGFDGLAFGRVNFAPLLARLGRSAAVSTRRVLIRSLIDGSDLDPRHFSERKSKQSIRLANPQPRRKKNIYIYIFLRKIVSALTVIVPYCRFYAPDGGVVEFLCHCFAAGLNYLLPVV